MRKRNNDSQRINEVKFPFLSGLLLICSCSATAQIRDLQEAEIHERNKRHDEALLSYRTAQTSCQALHSERMRKKNCLAAHLQYAELLVTLRRFPEALRAYQHAESTLQHRPARAQAAFSKARLHFQIGQIPKAILAFWHTLKTYPNEAFAGDALGYLIRIQRKKNPTLLQSQMLKLSESLRHTKISDNLLLGLAQLEETEFHSPDIALQYYDQLVKQHKSSGLYDDALWHAARLSRQLGNPKGAVTRLKKLLQTREVAFGTGSYFSIWLDDAQLTLGIILRDDLQKYEEATQVFTMLPTDYPASVLQDDALYHKALTQSKAKHAIEACQDLQKLKNNYSDSKYNVEMAPELYSALHCEL